MPTTNPLIIKYQESVKIFEKDVLPIIVVRSNGVKSATYLIGLVKSFLLIDHLSSWKAEIKRGEKMKHEIDDVKEEFRVLTQRKKDYNSALTLFLKPYYSAVEWGERELNKTNK